uniref:Uncharacterized protein n=1 Tax=Rattus norvegicus TaxID=10116 RepID=A0A8I5ZMX7_RAT
MTRLGSRLPAAAARPRVPPTSLQHRLTGKIIMSQLLLAILTLSGLLPNAEVLTVGADQGPVRFVPFPPGTFGLGCGFCLGIPSAADVGAEFAFL